ncbi:hypothetical protein WA026_007470 [Henosepilachna vigintioctopunctata]|uniref:Uncharacterized protein n=1 Tax=Henosepilachna vigintioctopunctata TaxID=420089 RepID=A0AAW1UXD4_9CUCU
MNFVKNKFRSRLTESSKSCIDNILINQSNFKSKTIRTTMSDHDTAQLLTIQEQIQQTHEYQYKRYITSNNTEDLVKRLKLQEWNSVYEIPEEEINQQWEKFTNIFKTELNYACPLRKTKISGKKNQKSRNEKLSKCKTRLDILHTCKTFNPMFMELYKEVKKEYDKMLRDEKGDIYRQQILQSDISRI